MGIEVIGATVSAAKVLTGGAQTFTNQGSASGIVNVIGVGATPLGGSLPAPNVLSKYASYNYVIGLSAMTLSDYNFPDQSYKKGKVMPIICKTAGADPDNRVNTAYGKFDFFIDNLVLDAVIGLTDARTTNVTTIKFEVYEPYSLGVFVMALQTAAASCGLKNWREAPFLLTIDFRGNTESGQMLKVPFSTRHIPIKLTTIQLRASETGSKYIVEGYASQGQALTTQYANLKTDTIIKGKTVQEVLQTGKQSLQSVVNDRLQEFVKNGQVKVADKVIILFPQTISSDSGAGGTATTDSGATVSTTVAASAGTVFEKIGVSETDLVQNTELNQLGATEMGYSYERKGDSSTSKESETYDEKTGIWKRGSMVVNSKEGTLKFTQNMDIPSVINQVLLTSNYSKVALKSGEVSNTGMRKWWRIDTQVYYLPSEDNLPKTGTYPRVIVYRVVPYDAHVGKSMAQNERPPGLDAIKQQLVKNYDYIYTGKNSEILKFDIDYSINFANVLAADDGKNSIDASLASKNADANANKTKPANETQVVSGSAPAGVIGTQPSQGKQDKTDDGSVGGGGQETAANRVGRFFHMGITNPNDMINLSMEIMGDPYWIVNSGMGNYTSKPVDGVKDLCKDGSVNWQSGEVDIGVYFRSPLDINQGTGLYDFKSANTFSLVKAGKASPVIAFTGLYKINQVTNVFKGGRFTQTLLGYRRPLQELQNTANPKKALSSDNQSEGANPVDNKS